MLSSKRPKQKFERFRSSLWLCSSRQWPLEPSRTSLRRCVCIDKQDPYLCGKGLIFESKIVLMLKVNCCKFRAPRPTGVDIGVPWSSLRHHLPLIIPGEVFYALHQAALQYRLQGWHPVHNVSVLSSWQISISANCCSKQLTKLSWTRYSHF